jgi:protein-S-isoprenylcysteine O-methyltransferase Ste14
VAGRRLPDLGPHGEGWVLIQVVLFVAIILGTGLGPAWAGSLRVAGQVVGAVVGVAGLVLLFRGFADLGSNLTPFPKPKADAHLVDHGSYGLVRHPIYGGLIVGALGLGLFTASPMVIVLAVALGVFFDLKSRREELWLSEKFRDYAAYRGRTHKLLPWVY